VPSRQHLSSNKSTFTQAYINVPKEDEAARPTKGAADRAVLDRLAINVSPKLFAYRIQLIKSWDQLKQASLSMYPESFRACGSYGKWERGGGEEGS